MLCGHSYAGAVISGVADRIPDRVRSLVYLDAFLLEDGQCLHDLLPEDQRQQQLDWRDERRATVGKSRPYPENSFM